MLFSICYRSQEITNPRQTELVEKQEWKTTGPTDRWVVSMVNRFLIRGEKKMEEKNSRRTFFKHISKYALGFGTFAAASLLGFKSGGNLQLGKMKDIELGLSEAQGQCGFGAGCAGGGGDCGFGAGCAGGGGKCGFGAGCAGS